jgi:hypothetical protein
MRKTLLTTDVFPLRFEFSQAAALGFSCACLFSEEFYHREGGSQDFIYRPRKKQS